MKSVVQPLIDKAMDSNTEIDIEQIKSFCRSGSLSETSPLDRAVCYLLLQKVYPRNPRKWEETNNQIKTLYKMFVDEYHLENWTEFIITPTEKKEDYQLARRDIMNVIHQDICRSGQHIYFLEPEEIPNEADPNSIQSSFMHHMRRLERILYAFAITNPFISYMQGFNEIVSPLYYVIHQARKFFKNDMFQIEAITYMLFQNLITNTDLQDLFTTQHQAESIMEKMDIFQNILKETLPDVYKILNNLNIKPIVYAYRWFNNLFSQEHDLPFLLILWDSIFSHTESIINYSFYVGIAHLYDVSTKLIPDDYSKTLFLLQNMKISNPLLVIHNAEKLWNQHKQNSHQKKKK